MKYHSFLVTYNMHIGGLWDTFKSCFKNWAEASAFVTNMIARDDFRLVSIKTVW